MKNLYKQSISSAFGQHSIFQKFLVWIMPLIAFAIMLMGVIVYQQVKTNQYKTVTALAEQTIELQGEKISVWIEGLYNELEAIVASPELKSMDWSKMEGTLKHLVAKRGDTYAFLGIVSADGTNYTTAAGKGTQSYKGRTFYNDIFEKNYDFRLTIRRCRGF